MRKSVLIIRREYRVQIRQKSFKIMTFLAPIVIIALILIITFINHFSSIRQNIAVIDESHQIYPELKSGNTFAFIFSNSSEKEKIKKRLQKDIDAMLLIPKTEHLDYLEKSISFYSYKLPSTKLINELQKVLSQRITNLKLIKKCVYNTSLKDYETHVQLKTISLKDQTHRQIQRTESKTLLLGIMMYILMMFIIIYGVRVMRGVLEEKNNRVVEIIISSVQPFQLMMGKIIGTALVALTQFTLWLLIFLIAFLVFQWYPLDLIKNIKEIPLGKIYIFIQSFKTLNLTFLLSLFFLYFIGGYLLFSAFFAAIGAIIENGSDTQQYSIISSVILIIGFYGGILALDNPDSSIVFWLSMIPLTSSITMLGRLYSNINEWQIVVSLIILGISVWLMIVLSSKIYRLGILKYGEKIGLIKIYKRWFYMRN